MDWTKAGLWVSLLVGGLVLCIISSYSQYATKDPNEEFRIRPVLRDFCLGAVGSATLYSFLPESLDNMLNNVTSVTDVKVESPEIELQTGPARF